MALALGVLQALSPSGAASATAPPDQRSSATFTYQGLPYPYTTFAPGTRQSRPPLLVALHGCGTTPASLEEATELDALAHREGLVVVYPDSTVDDAEVNCFRAASLPALETRTTGDAAALAALTRAVAAQFHADATRIYLLGMSGGAIEAAMLGPLFPDLYAASALHSGIGYGHGGAGCLKQYVSTLTPTQMASSAFAAQGSFRRLLPSIVFHGTADQTVAYQCGRESTEQVRLMNNLTLQALGSTSRLSAAPTHSLTSTAGSKQGLTWVRESWELPGNRCPVLQMWSVQGMDHRWSGEPHPDPLPGDGFGGPSATTYLWDFLSRISKTPLGYTCARR